MRKVINQHGDVILRRIGSIPSGAKKIEVKNGRALICGVVEHSEKGLRELESKTDKEIEACLPYEVA